MGQLVIGPPAVAVAAVEGIKPAEVQVQGQGGDGHALQRPIGPEDQAWLFPLFPDQLPQKEGKGHRHQVVGDKGDIIAAFGEDPPEEPGHPVKGPGHRVAEQPRDAHDEEGSGHFLLFEFPSEQVEDHGEDQRDPHFAGRKLHTLHIVSFLLFGLAAPFSPFPREFSAQERNIFNIVSRFSEEIKRGRENNRIKNRFVVQFLQPAAGKP